MVPIWDLITCVSVVTAPETCFALWSPNPVTFEKISVQNSTNEILPDSDSYNMAGRPKTCSLSSSVAFMNDTNIEPNSFPAHVLPITSNAFKAKLVI